MHPHTPKLIGEHGASAPAPHPFKRHAGAHSNPFHYNYKRFHFNKRHQQGQNQPTPGSPSMLSSPGKLLLKNPKMLINTPNVTAVVAGEKIGDLGIVKKVCF